MSINIRNNFVLIFCSSLLLFGCSQKNNNIDLSNLPTIKQKKAVDTKKEKIDSLNIKNGKYIEDLVPYKNKEKVLSKFEFGKSDPFSESENLVTKFSSDFKLNGFLNTNFKKYVFVTYLGNEGTISEDSVGGANTNLLPKGAKVINIDPEASRLTISHENKDFVFEL